MQERITTHSVIVYGFLSVIVILIAITAIGSVRIHNLTSGLDTIVEEREEQIFLMHTMRHVARERSMLLQSMMITSDPFTVDDYAMEMSRLAGIYFRTREQLLQHKLSSKERTLLEIQNQQSSKTGSVQNLIITLVNDEQHKEAELQLRDHVLPGQRQAMAMMDQFIAIKRAQNIDSLEQIRKDIDFTYGLMIALSGLGVIFSLSIAYLVSRRINREMQQRISTENSLRHSELQERTIRENIVDGILTLDAAGSILSCNQACRNIFGCEPEEMVGKNVRMLLPSSFAERSSSSLERHLQAWDKKLLGSGHEVTGQRKDGGQFPAELDVSRVEMDGKATYIVVVRDITEKKADKLRLQQFNKELEEQVTQRTEELASTNEALRAEISERIRAQKELTHLATHDTLTGLPNRALFTEQLSSNLFHAERRNNTLALLFMDLDGFKQVNDTHGHEAGDKLLVEVARRMKEAVRREDLVARTGGDEFIIILNDLSTQSDAELIAHKLIAAINQPVICNDTICHIGISIGIAFYPDNATNPDALIRHADDAMYSAKKAGKNCYHISSSTQLTAGQNLSLF